MAGFGVGLQGGAWWYTVSPQTSLLLLHPPHWGSAKGLRRQAHTALRPPPGPVLYTQTCQAAGAPHTPHLTLPPGLLGSGPATVCPRPVPRLFYQQDDSSHKDIERCPGSLSVKKERKIHLCWGQADCDRVQMRQIQMATWPRTAWL